MSEETKPSNTLISGFQLSELLVKRPSLCSFAKAAPTDSSRYPGSFCLESRRIISRARFTTGWRSSWEKRVCVCVIIFVVAMSLSLSGCTWSQRLVIFIFCESCLCLVGNIMAYLSATSCRSCFSPSHWHLWRAVSLTDPEITLNFQCLFC